MPEQRTGWLDSRQIRARIDLQTIDRCVGNSRHWVVKDPVGLQYYFFGQREWFILDRLKSGESPREIISQFNKQFAPYQLAPRELNSFIVKARIDGLLIVDDQLGQGQALLNKSNRDRWRAAMFKPFQILVIRFRGVDPEWLLTKLIPFARLLFSPLTIGLVFALTIFSLIWLFSQSEWIIRRLPELNTFFLGQNLILILLTMAAIKILHELGHGMACKRYGGECHEIGFMLLAFMPCLYCNVSDSWMLRSRWKRIMVNAAGMYVELILANICFFLWFFSQPGLLNFLCLNVVVICSVNTLLLNGNPLLRYDGYYILADFVEVPNLAQQSRAAFWGGLSKWFVRQPAGEPGQSNGAIGLSIYALCSMIYRIFVIAVILWGIHWVLKQNDLEALFYVIAMLVLTGMILPALTKLRVRLAMPGTGNMIRWGRVALATAAVVAGVYALWNLQLTHRIAAPLILEAEDAAYIYDGGGPVDLV